MSTGPTAPASAPTATSTWCATAAEREGPAALARAIVADLEAHAAVAGRRRLVSVFFGGGTPSLMDPDWAGDDPGDGAAAFEPAANLEVTLEANPTDAEAGRFAAFAAAGVNRLSLGCSRWTTQRWPFWAATTTPPRRAGRPRSPRRSFRRLSIDLIYARPGQTPAAWRAELGEALALGAEHLSPYQLTIEAGTAFDRAVRPRPLVAARRRTLRPRFTRPPRTCLRTLGSSAYEVSNHARGGPRARDTT